ncbi:hypothetical protein K2X05_11390 [bacterium]|nr:hypothetical protein [bacterium]
MNNKIKSLQKWIKEMAALIEENADLDSQHFLSFLNEPELSLLLIELIEGLDENALEEERVYYSACIFAMDICVAQLAASQESGNKLAGKTLNHLMSELAKALDKNQHSLSFWLPILNSFYDVHVELSQELRDAYCDLASEDEEIVFDNEIDHLEAIREMITDFSDLSLFDIAENFFAQSHAMPVDFFADFMVDLYNIEEGQDIALLSLLHPNRDVRELVFMTMKQLINTIVLSPISLTRLQAIKNWYPQEYHEQFNHWIKIQRKKGVVFHKEEGLIIQGIKASEVDGSGAQGVFIHLKNGRNNYLCGLLFKEAIGIKDVWMTPSLSLSDVKKYYKEAFEDNVTLRQVDEEYLVLMIEHFLALTMQHDNVPDLHLLEIQESMGLHFLPKLIDIPSLMDQLSIQISPFTPKAMQTSFQRSKTWLKNKQFTESWFIENANVDKLVNRCSSFVDGIRVCDIEDAVAVVFEQEMEQHRDVWLFHFLWTALWLKSHTRKNEKTWEDSFFIAYAIYSDQPLNQIPVLQEINHQTVINSIETMSERRTHLNQE